MRLPRTLCVCTLTLMMLSVAACGGSTGPAPDAEVPAQLALLKAVLLGSLETTVVDMNARAAILVDLREDGQLQYGCAVQAGYVTDITAMHIHRGGPGVDGPIEVNLLSGGTSFDAGALTAEATLTIGAALAAEIAASPADFYVNIHTTGAGGGLVRQQLESGTGIEALATLLGENEMPVVDMGARGACTLSVNGNHTVTYTIAMRSPSVSDVTMAHVHVGPADVNGSVFVDLQTDSATVDGTLGTITGTVPVTLGQVARICNALGGFYVNVHTAAYPAGVARGQLGPGPVDFWMPLLASEELMTPSNPNARGGVTLRFDSLTTGTAHLAVPPAEDITSITGAHVHEGAAEVNGDILIDLRAGADFVTSPGSFSAEGSIACTPSLLARILANPAGFYVNFHTAMDSAGIVRNQLSQEPITFFTTLSGDNEVPPVSPPGMGAFSMVATGIYQCSFTASMTTPPAPDVTAGHMHDGAVGVNGPALINLLGGTNVEVSGSSITGQASFTGRTLARLLAVPERFYCNMHTVAEPDGVARGQLERQTADSPPAISYQTPVTYTEATPITNNVPTSLGGAVSSYSVDPPLPAGLMIDASTGVISGTPAGASAAADFTVTATNQAGSADATVNITVDPLAPTDLSYTTNVTYAVGTQITPNNPSNSGGEITMYSVAPALPAGLSIHPTTGSITGTPTTASAEATYTVTGSNAADSTTFGIVITVDAELQPPSGLSYSTPVTYSTGHQITPNTPSVSGGMVDTWSVSPSLPSGLSLDANGAIVGTPTTITSAADYEVTATNAAGSTMATVNIEVELGAPTNLSYMPGGMIGYVGTEIEDMTPSSDGGAVSSYSVDPALPAGLSLDTSTGVISGEPTTPAEQANYTVTATNSAGSTTVDVSIIVY